MTSIEKDLAWFRSIIFPKNMESVLNDDDIVSIAISFPALLVAKADDFIDKKEKLFICNIARALSDINDSEDLKELKYLERYYVFMKLMEFDISIQDKILEIVSNYCESDQLLRNSIEESMMGIAQASEGVSQEEIDKIKWLKLKLKFPMVN